MFKHMAYSLDSSVLITAWRRNYPPGVFPTLWSNLADLIDNGSMVASIEVRTELERKDDEVLAWTKDREHLYVPIDGETQRRVLEILAQFPRLIDIRRNRSGADPWVIALAQVRGLVVVSFEEKSNSATRPKIPDVCDGMPSKVECINLVQLAQREGWTF